jgi:hypothetical protein
VCLKRATKLLKLVMIVRYGQMNRKSYFYRSTDQKIGIKFTTSNIFQAHQTENALLAMQPELHFKPILKKKI